MTTTAIPNGRPRGRAVVAGILVALAGSPVAAAAKGPPPPLVGHVEPCRGPPEGGTPVTITGSNFRPGARVWMGEGEATGVVVVSEHRIDAVAPPHRPGRVYVAVRNVDGQEGGRGWTFTYAP